MSITWSPERLSLIEELRRIEQSYPQVITRDKRRRAQEILRILHECRCRHCGKTYDELKVRGDWKGFCSAKCQHALAKLLGFKKGKGRSEYDVLKLAKCIGSVFTLP